MSVLRVPVTPEDHVRGPADAPVTLVEYGDYECPHCGAAHPNVLLLQQHFGGQLRCVFRHFPLTQIHPNAEPAAETAEYAGTHGKFWLRADFLGGVRSGVNGTPTFFINGRRHEGTFAFDDLAAAIDAHLALSLA
jgi:protein-disulfide isomerase